MTVMRIPSLSLICLVGPSSSGKSTFASRLFKATEVLSSDRFRGIVSDDENDQEVSHLAFKLLHQAVEARLAYGRLVVVDATNVEMFARQALLALAKRYHCRAVAIVFALSDELLFERNLRRGDRFLPPRALARQIEALKQSMGRLDQEGFHHVFTLEGLDAIDRATIEREPSRTDRAFDHGPFDIIGDIHGCYAELISLLRRLGYELAPRDDVRGADAEWRLVGNAGRKLVFLGDLVDRGPRTPAVLRLVMDAVAEGRALCVPGNHDVKLVKALRGAAVTRTHGLAESMAQLEGESPSFREQVAAFIDGLPSHYILDGKRLAVAHAGVKEAMQGRSTRSVRGFCLYGESTGEIDSLGLPVRYPWAVNYRGKATVVFGHTPLPQAEEVNNTICIDTGCVFGGALTCLRYPERELVAVPAECVYYQKGG